MRLKKILMEYFTYHYYNNSKIKTVPKNKLIKNNTSIDNTRENIS
jgi:hypothetical protein